MTAFGKACWFTARSPVLEPIAARSLFFGILPRIVSECREAKWSVVPLRKEAQAVSDDVLECWARARNPLPSAPVHRSS